MRWRTRGFSLCISAKTQNIYDWEIYEVCDYDLPILIYYINCQIIEILLFKRSAIVFRKGKSLHVEVYYNFATVY